MTDPYVTPDSDLSTPPQTSAGVELIRQGQKLLIYAIVLNVAVTLLLAFVPALAGIDIGLQLVVLGVSIYGLVKLFQGFRTPIWARILLFITMLIPLVNIVVLLVLNARATKALRAAGYTVGLMGASK